MLFVVRCSSPVSLFDGGSWVVPPPVVEGAVTLVQPDLMILSRFPTRVFGTTLSQVFRLMVFQRTRPRLTQLTPLQRQSNGVRATIHLTPHMRNVRTNHHPSGVTSTIRPRPVITVSVPIRSRIRVRVRVPFTRAGLHHPACPLPNERLPFTLMRNKQSNRATFRTRRPAIIQHSVTRFRIHPRPIIHRITSHRPSRHPSKRSRLLARNRRPNPSVIRLPSRVIPGQRSRLPHRDHPFPGPHLRHQDSVSRHPMCLIRPQVTRQSLQVRRRLRPSIPKRASLIKIRRALAKHRLVPSSAHRHLRVMTVNVRKGVIRRPYQRSRIRHLQIVFHRRLGQLRRHQAMTRPTRRPLILTPTTGQRVPSRHRTSVVTMRARVLHPSHVSKERVAVSTQVRREVRFTNHRRIVQASRSQQPPFPLLRQARARKSQAILIPFTNALSLRRHTPMNRLRGQRRHRIRRVISQVVSPLLERRLLERMVTSYRRHAILLRVNQESIRRAKGARQTLNS